MPAFTRSSISIFYIGHEHVLDRQSGIREVSIKELVIESRARREVDPSDETITESWSSNITIAATKSASTTPTTPPTTHSTTVFPQDCQIVTVSLTTCSNL